MADHRMVNTDDLLYLGEVAEAYGFNRVLDMDKIREVIDPDGTHILQLVLFDHQRPAPKRNTAQNHVLAGLGLDKMSHGDPVHHRVRGLLKQKDTMEPIEFMLDVPADMWGKLKEAEVLDS